MLGMKAYDPKYIEDCHSRVESGVSAYKKLAAAVRKHPEDAGLASALVALETAFFNNLLLTLDYSFVHRVAMVEGKDGNPLNEVRILCNSVLLNHGVMAKSYPWPHVSALGDKSIKLSPENSVLKQELGEEIELTEVEFSRLSDAFFEEMRRKFAAADS